MKALANAEDEARLCRPQKDLLRMWQVDRVHVDEDKELNNVEE